MEKNVIMIGRNANQKIKYVMKLEVEKNVN